MAKCDNSVTTAKVGAKSSVLNGRAFQRKGSGIYAMELISLQDAALNASAPVTTTKRLTDANAELTRVVEQVKRLGGPTAEPVVLGIGWRFRQTVTITAIGGAPTVPMLLAPFSARYQRATVNVTIGSAGNVYLKGKTFPLSTVHDLARVEIAPSLFRYCYDAIEELRAPRVDSVNDALATPATSVSVFNGPAPRRPFLDTNQLRCVYAGATGVTEPRAGTPDGDFTLFPLTLDGIDGDAYGAGVRLSALRDLAEGQVNWQLTLENDWSAVVAPAVTPSLYRTGVPAEDPAFGTIEVTPILFYRVGDFSPSGAERGLNLEGETWEYRDNLPVLDNSTSTLDLAAQQVAGLTFLGWRRRYHGPSVDANRMFLLGVDTALAVPYSPCIRMIPPSINVATNNFVRGNFLSIGSPQQEEFPLDSDALGVRLIREYNDPWYRMDVYGSAFNRSIMGDELPTFQNATDRTATTSLVACFPIRYGATGWAAAAPVTSITITSTGNVADIGGYQRLPIAYSNPSVQGAPSLGAREVTIDGNGVVAMDNRTLHIARSGQWAPPLYTVDGAQRGAPISILQRSGPYASCDGKPAMPVTIPGMNPDSVVLSAALSTTYSKVG